MKTMKIFGIIACLAVFLVSGTQTIAQVMDPKVIKEIYKEILTETDKNKDGKISKAEYLAIYKDDKKAEKDFDKWDLDGDGLLTEEEYVKAIQNMSKEKP